jgi:putative ABC transport system ATP-binding protein
MADYALETSDLAKIYKTAGGEVNALIDADIRVKKGENVAVIGPSGSGKSTFLSMIGLLDRPTKGEVLIDGIRTSRLNDDALTRIRREKVGFIFQQYNLISTLTARENIQLPLYLQGRSISEINRKISSIVEKLSLDEKFLEHFPAQLSGGQQQRVAIARALVSEPAIVLGDEPTGNLDSNTSEQTMELLKELHETTGLTMLMVTHDMHIAEYMERVVTIRDGRLYEDG